MTETLTAKSLPTAPTSSTLDALADKIKGHLKAIDEAMRSSIMRAVELGELLSRAKAEIGHGDWGRWLELNCSLNERTAQRYMKLAGERKRIEEIARNKSVNVSDLTISQAQRLLMQTSQDKSSDENPFDVYEGLRTKLIKKLKALPPDDAEAVSNETIKKLRDAVSEMKQIAKNTKAAS